MIVGELPVDGGGDVVTIDDIVEFLDGTPVANVIDSINDLPTAATKAVPGVTEFQFGVAIVDGLMLPFDIPQISIGFTGLDLGVVEAAGFLGLGAYADRQSVLDGNASFNVNFAGGIAITSTVEGIDGNASISLQGEFRPGSEGVDSELDVRALAELSFSTPASLPGFQLDVQNVAAQFEMLVSINDDFEFSLNTLELSQASVGSVTATFGGTVQSDGTVTDPLLRLAATEISLDLSDSATHLLTFGSVSASLPGAPDPIAGLGGEVVNFAIDIFDAGTPEARIAFNALDGFGISFMIPEPEPGSPGFLEELGIPDIIEVSEFGFRAKPAFNDPLNPDYTAFELSVSASLDLPIGDSGINASVDDLTIDVQQLAQGDFFAHLISKRLKLASVRLILGRYSCKATY